MTFRRPQKDVAMGTAIGAMFGFAAGVAVSPLSVLAIILLLASPHGRATGSLFALGWLVGLAVIGTAVLLVVGPADPTDDGGPATWTGWLKLALGMARDVAPTMPMT